MKKFLYFILLLIISIIFYQVLNYNASIKNKWVNWGGNQICNPKKIYYPKSYDELLEIIKQAYKNKDKIRAFGSSHSWSPIVCSAYLISTKKLNKILLIDKEKKIVRVEAGIKIYELNKKLHKAGLALPNQSYTQAQSLGGNITTSTHGTGHTGTFSSFVKEIELITPDGNMKKLSAENSSDEFEAACVSLGELGIIYAVTIQCVPAFNVEHTRIYSTWKILEKEYKKIYQEHDFFQFLWNPYKDSVMLQIWDKTEKKETKLSNFLFRVKNRFFFGYWTGAFWKKIIGFFPSITPNLIKFVHWAGQTEGLVGRSYELMTAVQKSNQEVVYQEEEIAIPTENLIEAMADIKELLDKYSKEDFYPIIWGILFRFVKADKQSYLSTAIDRDSVYISITAPQINENFYKEFEEKMLKYKGRPHWGKINFLDYNRAKNLYGENLDKFIDIRKKMDPEELLSNDYTKRIFNRK